MIGKSKSSKKTEKVLTELIDLSALKSMQHRAESIFVQAANMTLLCHDSYLKYRKPGVKPDTWCVPGNNPLHHSAVFPDAVIAKAEEDSSTFKADSHPPSPARVLAGTVTVQGVKTLPH